MSDKYERYDERITKLLTAAIKTGASDVHVKSDFKIRLRVSGVLRPTREDWDEKSTSDAIKSTMTPDQWSKYQETWELDYGVAIPYREDDGEIVIKRFRANAFFSKGKPGVIFRLIQSNPPNLADMGLPDSVFELAEEKNGLVLMVGATGSGKSTTIAGIIDHINSNSYVNIITLEDPVEFVHQDKKASIIQREVETDTHSFKNGLKSMLRQDPDVILLGELRDADTVRTALEAANTGHLVFATLHASTAASAIDRVIDLFRDPEEQHQIRQSLSDSLRGVIAQRLLPKIGGGRVAALEVLINKGRISKAIANPDRADVEEIMKESEKQYNMQMLETHLLQLVIDGKITPETAIAFANKAHDLKRDLRAVVDAKPLRVIPV